MIADVILGVTDETAYLIKDLKLQNYEYIFVIDYEYFEEPISIEGVTYFSALEAKVQLAKFDVVYYYKSLYIYPGMGGKMSSLYKK